MSSIPSSPNAPGRLLEPQDQVGALSGHPELPLDGGLFIVPNRRSLGVKQRFEQNLPVFTEHRRTGNRTHLSMFAIIPDPPAGLSDSPGFTPSFRGICFHPARRRITRTVLCQHRKIRPFHDYVRRRRQRPSSAIEPEHARDGIAKKNGVR